MTDLLLEGLWASTAAIAVVLLLRAPWRRAFGAERAPLLWAIVPAVLIAVALPARHAPVSAGAMPMQPITVPLMTAPTTPSTLPWIDLLLGAWLVGALAFAAGFAMQQRRFRRRIGTLTPRGDGTYAASGTACGPAVLGVLRPRIVLPADFEQRYSDEQQRLIVQHERSHARRGDVAANAVATALRTLYWFNPLVHYAASRLRHDHELASDAEVVRLHPHARRRYADTLLDVQLAVPGLPVGCLWQSSHPLKERITMLKHSLPGTTRRRIGLAVGLVLSAGCAGIAWAAQPPQPAELSTPEPALHAVAPPGDDVAVTYKTATPPKYPRASVDGKQSGKVVLRVLVGTDGAAQAIEIERGVNAELDAAAQEAVKGWTFNPAVKDGKPIADWVLVPICFSLDEDGMPACDATDETSASTNGPAVEGMAIYLNDTAATTGAWQFSPTFADEKPADNC